MPENLMMPSMIHLLSGTHRNIIHQKCVEFILILYKQLYQAVQNPTNGYNNPTQLMPRTPEQLMEIFLGPQPDELEKKSKQEELSLSN